VNIPDEGKMRYFAFMEERKVGIYCFKKINMDNLRRMVDSLHFIFSDESTCSPDSASRKEFCPLHTFCTASVQLHLFEIGMMKKVSIFIA